MRRLIVITDFMLNFYNQITKHKTYEWQSMRQYCLKINSEFTKSNDSRSFSGSHFDFIAP